MPIAELAKCGSQLLITVLEVNNFEMLVVNLLCFV
jgi:hypothetical protein